MIAERPDSHGHRTRLIDALAGLIGTKGYRECTVSDIVREARVSKRAFYQHFTSKEDCYAAMLGMLNDLMVARIAEVVDPAASWQEQIEAGVRRWAEFLEERPAITVSWIRDSPGLGADTRDMKRRNDETLVSMVQALSATDGLSGLWDTPTAHEVTTMLIGGLRELAASAVEQGRPINEVADTAVAASIALLSVAVAGLGERRGAAPRS